jgi:hypothetical protein
VAHPRQVLALGRVGPVGLLLGLPQALLVQAHELGDVLDPVDDVGQVPVRPQDRGVERAPVADLEPAALGFGTADVVLLHRHRVGHPAVPHPVQGGAQVPNAGGLRVVGVVGEDLEQPAAQDVLAPGHGGVQVGVAHRHDHQPRVQDQIASRRRLEQGPEVQGMGLILIVHEQRHLLDHGA